MKSDCTGLENGVICRTHPCAPNELSSSQFYTLNNRVSSLMHGFNWATIVGIFGTKYTPVSLDIHVYLDLAVHTT